MYRLLALSMFTLFAAQAVAGPGVNTITVTTTLDGLNNADGLCSLREAIRNANTNTVYSPLLGECPAGSATLTDVIVLNAGEAYVLTVPGTGDNQGDLDILAQPLVPAGRAHLRIQSNSEMSRALIMQSVLGERVIENDQARLELVGLNIRNGFSFDTGGGILNREGDLRLERSQLLNNQAMDGGGLANLGGTVALVDSEVWSNNASTGRGGGALNEAGGTLIVANSWFFDNLARNGGGIANHEGTVQVRSGSRFNLNRAVGNDATNGNGGAIHSAAGASVDIEDADFDQNEATSPFPDDSGRGGAVHMSAMPILTVRDSRFTGNTAQGFGGAIRSQVSDLKNTTFVENQTLGRNGGAVHTFALYCQRCVFDRNKAFSSGGAVYTVGNAQASETSVLANEAGYSGGGFNVDYGFFTDMAMIGNKVGSGATGFGGALVARSSVFIDRCQVESNTALRDGAGFRLFGSSGGAYIRNCAFIGNISEQAGGAIYTSRRVNLTNTTISGNVAAEGGGLYIQESALVRLNHVTLANNGGDNVHKYGELRVRNSLFKHQVGSSNCIMSLAVPLLESFGNNLSSDASCVGLDVAENDLIGVDPMLAPLANHGSPLLTHALLPGSPAIDGASLPSCMDMEETLGLDDFTGAWGIDQRGAPRPFGSACDIGAHEQGAIVVGIFSDGFESD